MGEAQPQSLLTDRLSVSLSLNVEKRRVSLCVGCGSQIHDQYILRVAPDLEWHAACLKCADCHQFLDETCTCFVRDGKTYCKRDYVRLFGAKCSKCCQNFSKNDFVMRARNKIYHLDCFHCVACARRLIPGDEFALRDDGLFCKADHEVLEKATTSPAPPLNGHSKASRNGSNNNNPNSNGTPLGSNNFSSSPLCFLPGVASREGSSDQMPSSRHRDSVRPHLHKQNGSTEHKPTRVRTVLNEKQLHTLRTCYAANPRPDALMKEQLVEMTGLSPRVIRVWFQNKRCKDKKKSIMMKQIQQQEKYVVIEADPRTMQMSPDGRHLSLGSLRGVPMVATSPVRHESPLQVNPIEVQAYQPPWKAVTEFALQPDMDPSAPQFQQLVNQMHGYGDPSEHGGPVSLVPMSSYLASEDSLHQPPSNLSSHIPGTPSELSSPTSD